jgi:hypothetical protein
MKKILTLLIMLIFSVQICLADDNSTEDIDSYFNEEPEQTQELNGYLQYNQDAEQIEHEEDAILLNKTEVKGINISKPKSFSSKSLMSNYKKPVFQPIQDELNPASKFSSQEYNIRPIKTTYSKKIGKFSFGTMYDSSLNSARVNYSTGVFTKYEGKYFALSTAFSKNTNSNYDSYDDKFFIVPELKLTKRLSLLDIMQTDVNQINKENEIVLRYTPHFKKYADEVQFELGAGQSFHEDNYIKSSLRFSTRFKL